MKLKTEYITKSEENRLHHCPVPVVALTGGIATGKTTASNFLKKIGFNVICADQLIKDIYAEQDTIKFISKEFPEVINDHNIDFKKLRVSAFTKDLNRLKLEKFLYARLPEHFNKSVNHTHRVVIYDVPLLYEKGLDRIVDYTLLIYAPEKTQIERLIKRDGIDETLARQILAKQFPIEDKKSKADHFIENTGEIQALEDSLKEWVSSIFIS